MTSTSTAVASPSARLMRMLYDSLPGGRLLNVGAGHTHTVVSSQWAVHVDIDFPAVRGSENYVVADGAFLPFKNEAFDGVLLKDIVEHAPDAIAVLAEARRVVRDGGRAVVVVPRAIARAVWDDPTHVRGFTRRALTTAAELAGWRLDGLPLRIGAVPGAGRLRLESRLTTVLRVPLVGHWFGTNWIVELVRP